ncbi:MAG: AAA family ATPase, partial [Pseudomonadota bacterium]
MEFADYTIAKKIYAGHKTDVYRAVHNKNQQPVIIKCPNSDYPAPRQIEQLQHEYELTHELELSGIINISEILQQGHQWALICEDVQGDSLDHLLNETHLALIDVLKIGIALSDALGEIHHHNLIHRDLKPANIIVHKDGEHYQVKITDFSVATQFSVESRLMVSPDALEGTLAYMAPEQTGRMNRQVDYRADLYSLGITLYEMLIGHPPFQGDDPMELVHAQIAKNPIDPHIVKPSIPVMVSSIVMKLLEKMAENRYQSAYGLKADLQHCLESMYQGKVDSNGTPAIETFPLGQQDITDTLHMPQTLYGRAEDAARLIAAFERISSGSMELLFVAGAAGIGKSSLVNEIVKPITAKNGYFIWGRFDKLQRGVPYSALIRGLRRLIQQFLTEDEDRLAHWREEFQQALGANGRLITNLLPELELIIGEQAKVPNLEPVEAQNRFIRVFGQFIQVFFEAPEPVVIFLDDLQWADSATLNLITNIVSDTRSNSLLFIGAYRDKENDALFMNLLNRLDSIEAPVQHINLEVLAVEDIAHFCGDALHCNHQTAMPLAELIMSKTGGNPFFIRHFLEMIRERGLLQFSRSAGLTPRWQWDTEKIYEMEITENVAELMLDRLKALPSETGKLLSLAAAV